jgi:hypothetical protein
MKRSLRIATAVAAATVGIGLVPASPASADPGAHGQKPHKPATSDTQNTGTSGPGPWVNEPPRGDIFVNDPARGNILDDIRDFFKRNFVSPCDRIKCCNNSNDSRTIHC